MKYSILIVEPSEIIVEGLRSILDKEPDINLLAPLHDAINLADRIVSAAPDLLLVNPTIAGCAGKRDLAVIRQRRTSMPIVAIVYQYVEREALDAYDAAIDIRANRGDVIATIRGKLKHGEKKQQVQEQPDDYGLSERETDVLILVAQGLSSKAIADQLNISIHTVNTHRKNITHKTGIKSVAGLALYAMIHNLT